MILLASALNHAPIRPSLPGEFMNRLSITAAAVSAALLSTYAAAETATPIEHLIVIVGENHTFDNLYATFKAAKGETVANLLSKGIIKEDGSPGANFGISAQQQASNTGGYTLSPTQSGPYATLPQPQTTYATGLNPGVADNRYPNNLPNGPFQMTNAKAPYNAAYFGDPVHRFFQMWQMTDKGKNDLFTWVAITTGAGGQNYPIGPVPGYTFQGGEAMGFYNMSAGDAPVFKQLADNFTLSDNFHQSIMGGTGANFLALITGDVAYYNQNGILAVPPTEQIENPNALAGTNNFYTQDGYQGGSYVNCADATQPGVKSILDYLATQKRVFNRGNCAANTYYLVNNYDLAYDAAGKLLPFDPTAKPAKNILPPQNIPTIADALSANGISWKYYSGGRNTDNTTTAEYCGICDPLIGFSSIMSTNLKNNLQGMDAFYADVQSDASLPAVSYIRPFESKAGHPANAKMPDFESFILDIVKRVQANPAVWKKTAILVTMDEGGGYYDSNYIQPIDFFGDGPRIPLIAVSPWAKKGHVDHSYGDHASILKFIEANWGLATLSERSRDNLPNPIHTSKSQYIPVNQPAISDLMGLFNFDADDYAVQADCLFNWAEKTYVGAFVPAGVVTATSGIYSYRYYPTSKVYLGISANDNHVYYQGTDGKLQDQGPLSYWLPLANCQ
jgi:phospholipase C